MPAPQLNAIVSQRIEVAPGVEITVITAAIGRALDEPIESIAESGGEEEVE